MFVLHFDSHIAAGTLGPTSTSLANTTNKSIFTCEEIKFERKISIELSPFIFTT